MDVRLIKDRVLETTQQRDRYRLRPEVREARLASNRLWKQKNHDKVIASIMKRKAIKREAEGFFTSYDLQQIREEQGGQCPGCLQFFSDVLPETIDHFKPLAKGGSNYPSNIQLLCAPCNCSKKDRLWSDWITHG